MSQLGEPDSRSHLQLHALWIHIYIARMISDCSTILSYWYGLWYGILIYVHWSIQAAVCSSNLLCKPTAYRIKNILYVCFIRKGTRLSEVISSMTVSWFSCRLSEIQAEGGEAGDASPNQRPSSLTQKKDIKENLWLWSDCTGYPETIQFQGISLTKAMSTTEPWPTSQKLIRRTDWNESFGRQCWTMH